MQTTTLSQTPPNTVVTLPRLLTQKELAEYLNKSTAWCERARWAGDGPRFIKLGRHVRYRAEDVLAWIEENSRTCSGEATA
ncbi:helix-turn-helix transcriptional regulator [Marinobacter sp. DUT-1]|uniref:helix-turn-helix transcriptional regulator n=1 Tax=Marinobacter sp. DUT-1 TaxID=3412037 RepID=UPI003D1753C9